MISNGQAPADCLARILKAWFDENYVIPNPVVATLDGLRWCLTADTADGGRESNKVASTASWTAAVLRRLPVVGRSPPKPGGTVMSSTNVGKIEGRIARESVARRTQ